MAAAIESFVDLDDEEADVIGRLSDVPLRNWNGIEVGALRATPELREGTERIAGVADRSTQKA
jgi:hypothetical protein